MTARVVTVTLNPAIDQTVMLDRLATGEVNRAKSARVDAGGKGVNVASCLADWGVPCAVTGLLGRVNASVFEALFDAKRIDDRFMRLSGETRTNIKVVDSSGTTDINLPGLQANAGALAPVAKTLADLCEPGVLVVLSGSLTAGIAADAYVELLRSVANTGARVVLDTSGAPLASVLAAPRALMPHAIKPNRHELQECLGRKLGTRDDLLVAARELLALGVQLVAISQGEDGALFVDEEGALQASPPVIETMSTVGAGDAMVAGLTAGLLEGLDLESTARLATAFAAGKLGLAGANLPPRLRIRELAALTYVEHLR